MSVKANIAGTFYWSSSSRHLAANETYQFINGTIGDNTSISGYFVAD